MRPVTTLLFLGILFTSPALFAQDPAAKPAAGAAPETSTPFQAPASNADSVLQPPPVVPANIDPNYILGTDDVIMVNVWKEPTLSGSLIIRPDGRISLPLVGDLPASGITPMALAADIHDNLKKFVNDPTVTVTVTASNSRRIYFLGEVQRSGAIPLSRDMTMLQAISAAGGLTPYANKSKMYVLRGPKGKQTRIPFNYKKALKDGNQQNVVLLPGDTIVVP